ncbi:CRISPR-associated DxTHG motif protein [uncultured Draconibacterium sp.]
MYLDISHGIRRRNARTD